MTIVVIALIAGSAMTILDNLVGAMLDIRLHADAYETVRQNMETLLSLANVQDTVEYGVSEMHPEIQWQTVIEPFFEPITNAMWMRAICSASYTDSKGQYQEIELEHWLTNLPANVVRQIIQQQKAEEEYLDLMSGTSSGQAEAVLQETTMAYLMEAGLNVDAYTSFLERQRRRKLEYVAKHGFDDDYKEFIDQLRYEEDVFLDQLGMDHDKYNIFAANYLPRVSGGTGLPGSATSGREMPADPSRPSDPPSGVDPGDSPPPPPPPVDDGWPSVEDMKSRGFPQWLIDLVESLRTQS